MQVHPGKPWHTALAAAYGGNAMGGVILLELKILQVPELRFDILGDPTRSSARNASDPAWTPAGRISDFGNSGWRTLDWKVVHEAPVWPGRTFFLEAGWQL